MNLNNIQLPSSLVEDLYRNLLIDTGSLEATINAKAVTTEKQLQYLGKNQKNICLLVNYDNDVYLPDTELSFLTAILQACKLDLGDVAIVNCNSQAISFDFLIEALSCKHLLVFGVPAATISLPQTSIFTVARQNGCKIMYSPAAEMLNNTQAESKALKSKLWLCLKQLFDI